MKWVIFLTIIIAIKVILTKGLMLALILLSFWIKGNTLKKSSTEWNNYFLTLNEKFVGRYAIILYAIATTLSSCVAYILFNVFDFQYPLYKTIILTIICITLSLLKYRKKGKQKLKNSLYEIHKFASKENDRKI